MQNLRQEPLSPPLMKKAFERAFPYAALLTENQRAQFVRAAVCLAVGHDTQPVEPLVADALDRFAARM